ncbi:hypothetical protein CVT24_000747 [Panaeolus cyanescens]|uniref:Hydrophobin n=1 Tax=Panaeolus cyanescens TaxID=181874 RepID=A0A409YCQ0_9AGAR|nr:hypothetical protein CVT24_000747 [Panaeolus cyanescens]
MFSKLAVVFTVAFGALSVAAGGTYTDENGIEYSCNSGPVQCCNSVQQVGSYDATAIAALIGVAAQDITGQLGVQCNPITGIGAGTGANCASSPVCCEKNFQNQLVGVNCSPITVGL